ncbi:hypothetical protein KQI84_07065 [bacterium]|nr:hypothetical protein [bacterium]
MIKVLAALAFLAGAGLLGWAGVMQWQRAAWRRKMADTRKYLHESGRLAAEEWPVPAVICRRNDHRIRRGRAALFLTDTDLWIEVDRPRRGVCVERRALLRVGTDPGPIGRDLGKNVLYLAWRQDPDGVVEGRFAVANPKIWAGRLSEMGTESD